MQSHQPITSIIANFLSTQDEKDAKQFEEKRAQALVELLHLEGRWQQSQEWKNGNDVLKLDPANITTREQLITFLQMVCQSHYFKGFDRSKLPSNSQQILTSEKYFTLFANAKLCDEMAYDQSKGQPHVMALLGSSESRVKGRLESLKKNLLENVIPTENIVYGLGTDTRALGKNVIESEKESIDRLGAAGKLANETNMVDMLTAEAVEDAKKANAQAAKVNYQSVNTTSEAKSREETNCVKTADTAMMMKKMIESLSHFSKMKKPIVVAAYSCQPFVERQRRDMQQKLGKDYSVVGVGRALTLKEFKSHELSIGVCLKELASLININFRLQEHSLKNTQTLLSPDELSALKDLVKQKEVNEKLDNSVTLTKLIP